MSTVHINAKNEDIAKVVLMPGDPKRAKYIATNFLKDYKLVNEIRGMEAYTGYYKDKLVTIFPSGMGNPSMGIYSYELFKFYNVEYIIRIGSMGGYSKNISLNDVVLATSSYSNSNYAKTLNNYDYKEITSDLYLNEVISNTALNLDINLKKEKVFCTDVFYENNNDYEKKETNLNVCGVEMESFALFSNALFLEKKATSLLTVSDLMYEDDYLTSEQREKGLNEMIVLALESAIKL